MKSSAVLVALMIAGVASGAAIAADSDHDASASNSSGCKIVHLKPGENPPTGMSTSVTAGSGSVSAQSTVGSGNGVTVHSGDGNVGASSISSSTNGNTTTVTTSDGHCTTYIKSQQ